jgi:hypothetical protein
VSCYRFWWELGHECLLQELKTEGKGSKEGVSGGCGSDCTAESESHGTVNLLRCTLSVVVNSLSGECLLHNTLLRRILAESVVQDIPTFPAYTRAL